MPRGVWFITPLLAFAGIVACSSGQGRRSGFTTEQAPTEPESGSSPNLGTSDLGRGSSEGGACASSRTAIARDPVVIEFIVDSSGSMDGQNSGPQGHLRWPAAREALLAAFADMHMNGDDATFVGIQRYGSWFGKGALPGSPTSDAHYDALVRVVSTTTAVDPVGNSGTVTVDGLTEGYRVVDTFKPPASAGLSIDDMKRVVVLMSDGVPNGGLSGQQSCESLVDKRNTQATRPVLTFAIGIGKFPTDANYDPKFMGRLSQKGGTAPSGCDPNSTELAKVCHFQVTPGDDVNAMKQALLDAINEIRALTTSCEFSFERNKHTDLGKIDVNVTTKDGSIASVPRDPDHGWTFDSDADPTKVVLHGDACASANGVISGRVDVVIGCKSAN